MSSLEFLLNHGIDQHVIDYYAHEMGKELQRCNGYTALDPPDCCDIGGGWDGR